MAQKPRSIFEDVGSARKQAAAPGGIDRRTQGARGSIRNWLLCLFLLVALMIVVGGLTRLTDSGLSITEWAPVTGAIPPLNQADWDAAFAAYKEIPEYQLQNAGMSLAEFKVIYWWEWGHRQLGRTVGLVWALGFVWFWARHKLPAGWTGRLLLLGGLGGLQGAIGWWMVSSGLQAGMLDVASYRLATHLGLAFVIMGLINWYALQLSRREADLLQARRAGDPRLARFAGVFAGAVFVQILLGALVAGIDAGRTYPEWPLMAGSFFPPEPFGLEPVWRNFFEDAGLVQFMHRCMGYVALALGLALWWRARKSARQHTRLSFNQLLAVLLVQMLLGIVTLLNSAPWHMAIAHQLVALVLWVMALRARFYARYPVAQSVRGPRR